MIQGAEEIAQCGELSLGTNVGEWFLNPEMGIRFQAFLNKNQSEEEMREEIRRALFQEPRIKTVEDIHFSVDRKNRTMDVYFSATAETGELIEREVTISAG